MNLLSVYWLVYVVERPQYQTPRYSHSPPCWQLGTTRLMETLVILETVDSIVASPRCRQPARDKNAAVLG